MTQRYDVSAPRKKKDGGTYWHRVGSAWQAKDGDGMNVEFDALPLPDAEGRVSVIIRPARDLREASGTPPRQSQAPARGGGRAADPEDSIPFAAEWR